jgi:hypothetical protein
MIAEQKRPLASYFAARWQKLFAVEQAGSETAAKTCTMKFQAPTLQFSS